MRFNPREQKDTLACSKKKEARNEKPASLGTEEQN